MCSMSPPVQQGGIGVCSTSMCTNLCSRLCEWPVQQVTPVLKRRFLYVCEGGEECVYLRESVCVRDFLGFCEIVRESESKRAREGARERERRVEHVCVHLKAITPGEAGTSLQHALLPLSEWHCLLHGVLWLSVHTQTESERESVCERERRGQHRRARSVCM